MKAIEITKILKQNKNISHIALKYYDVYNEQNIVSGNEELTRRQAFKTFNDKILWDTFVILKVFNITANYLCINYRNINDKEYNRLVKS